MVFPKFIFNMFMQSHFKQFNLSFIVHVVTCSLVSLSSCHKKFVNTVYNHVIHKIVVSELVNPLLPGNS